MRPAGVLCLVLCGAVVACSGDAGQNDSPQATAADSAGLSREAERRPLFTEQAVELGLIFQHYSGATGQYHMPEILGSGAALLDVDNDGDLDVFFVQGTDLEQGRTPLTPLPADQPPGNRLFANRLIETGNLYFEDVTDRAGLRDTLYGMGVAVSDYDNDGDQDMYVSGYADNAFYRNQNGRFEKIINAAGAQDNRWSSSASFCDINRDRWPDLYVTNYIRYQPTHKVVCRDSLSQQDYCSPKSYAPAPDSVFINNGDGTFGEASEIWGVAGAMGAGLGVLCRDMNQDGYADVYVANDSMANNLWINIGGTGLVDNAAVLGAALNINGLPEGSMGITAGDFDFDGDDDLFITHWNNETNTLYRNDLQSGFMDITNAVNLASSSFAHTGFGSDWLDFDNDGDLDLFIANGAVQRYVDATGRLSANYAQQNQLLRNDGTRFTDLSDVAFDLDLSPATSRAAAFGDIDNDGDTDIVVTNKDSAARLYINQTPIQRHWVGLKLEGVASNLDAIGAIVNLTLTDGRVVRRVVRRDGSYQSAHDPRIIIGLSAANTVPDVEVVWPAGGIQRLQNLSAGRFHTIVENAEKKPVQ